MSTDDTAALWQAVDRLTKPSRSQIHRSPGANPGMDWVGDLRDQADGVCYVDAYRAATARWATIPSLWDQAVGALTGGEVGGGTGSKPLRERSLADLDLMEIMGIVRDTTRMELNRIGTTAHTARQPALTLFHSREIRHLASLVITHQPTEIWWWEYRFASWGRLLETYLHAAEHTPRPTRLRNTPCPLCKTAYVTVEAENGDATVVRPIVVDFRDGYVRAARCEACSATWFRGAELAELARLVGAPGGEMMTA